MTGWESTKYRGVLCRRVLVAAAVPALLSWLAVLLQPNNLTALLASRLLAGLANGLLTGNVYMADVAPSKHISCLKETMNLHHKYHRWKNRKLTN